MPLPFPVQALWAAGCLVHVKTTYASLNSIHCSLPEDFNDALPPGSSFEKGTVLLQRASSVVHDVRPEAWSSLSVVRPANPNRSYPQAVGYAVELPMKRQHSTAHLALTELKTTAMPKALWALSTVCLLSIAAVLYCYKQEHTKTDDMNEEFFSRDATGKVYAYSNGQLLTWRVLFHKTPAIVMSWRVWVVIPSVLTTALIFVALITQGIKYATLLDVKSVDQFASYLRVFIAFMLGMFMTNSFKRWSSIVSNFRSFLTSVKQLMWTAHLMNVKQGLLDELERNCLVACYILNAEMHLDLGCDAREWAPHWEKTWKFLREEGLLTEEEEKDFREERESLLHIDFGRYSCAIWAWIGQLIGKVKEQPGILIPMYMRLVGASNACLAEVDQLKTCVQIQVPFTYAYLLSVIVHLNNVLLAVCSGLQIGFTLLNINAASATAAAGGIIPSELYQSLESLAMQVLILLIQPLMYQACLVIAHVLNHPFGDCAYHLPTETFILMLRDELKVSNDNFNTHKARKRIHELTAKADA